MALIKEQVRLCTLKVVGDESSILDYWAKRGISGKRSDWSGLYCQFDGEHASGTVGYRWENSYSSATLLQITWNFAGVVIIDDRDTNWMIDGSEQGDAKAARCKEILSIPQHVLLMDWLAQHQYAMLAREGEDQWEVVIPSELIRPESIVEEESLCQFKPHSAFPITSHIRYTGESWLKYEDGEALRPTIDAEARKSLCALLG